MSSLHGFGLGIASENAEGASLDTFYPRPLAQVTGAVANALQGVTGHLDAAQLKELASALEQAGETGLAAIAREFIDTDQKVVATPPGRQCCSGFR